ncbi:MAG: YceD family protein [Schleiferiaceae bacterium]|nr:YceD family protein [Schleiferiaceae bacterium]
MKNRETILGFSGLALGEHTFEYHLDETFFTSYPLSDLEGIRPATVHVLMRKTNTFMELDFSFSGILDAICDFSGDLFELEVQNAFRIVVKFGNAFDDSDPDILVLPHGEYEVDLAQTLFEVVALSVPIQKIKPELRAEMKEDLEEDDDLFGQDEI